MESINMNGIKVGNMNGVNAVNAPANPTEIKSEVEDTLKDTLGSAEVQAQEQEPKAQNKHVVTYIGSSEFTDSVGHKWHKHDEMTYTDEEYGARSDLHFMIKYGEMKHTVVTM